MDMSNDKKAKIYIPVSTEFSSNSITQQELAKLAEQILPNTPQIIGGVEINEIEITAGPLERDTEENLTPAQQKRVSWPKGPCS